MKRCYRFIGQEKQNAKGRYVFLMTVLSITSVLYARAYSQEHPNIVDEETPTGITIIQETESVIPTEETEYETTAIVEETETEETAVVETDPYEETEFETIEFFEEDIFEETEIKTTVDETQDVTLEETTETETNAINLMPKEVDEEFSEEDIFWLQKIVFAESRGEPQEGQIAVCNVVINRYLSSKYPDDVEEVILDTNYGKQFEPTDNGEVIFTDEYGVCRAVLAEDITEEVMESVNMAINGMDVVGERLFFHRYNGNESHENQVVIGNHVFY